MTSLDNTVPTRRVALIADAASYVGPALATLLAIRGHDLVLGQPGAELVEQLEEPFTGLIRVGPGLMTTVESKMSSDFQVRYPDASLPCDAQGKPNS